MSAEKTNSMKYHYVTNLALRLTYHERAQRNLFDDPFNFY